MKRITYANIDEIKELFMGRRIVATEIFDKPINIKGSYNSATGRLRLDNGKIVYIAPNQGGCSCGAGDYELTHLATVDNIITRVDVTEYDYRIFVLAGHEQINAMIVEGDDGSGYYGTGYELLVFDSGEMLTWGKGN